MFYIDAIINPPRIRHTPLSDLIYDLNFHRYFYLIIPRF